MASSVQHRTYSINVCWIEGVMPTFHLYIVHTHRHIRLFKVFPVLFLLHRRWIPLLSNSSVTKNWWEGEGGLGGRVSTQGTSSHSIQHCPPTPELSEVAGVLDPHPLVCFSTHPPLLSGTPDLLGIIYPKMKLQHPHLFVAGKTTKPVTARYLFGHKAPWFIKTFLISATCYAGLLVFILSWNSTTAGIHLREALYCCFYADLVIRH